jgi:branched-chain amino acid transport system permease protein
LLAQTTGFASLDVFALERSADLMLILVIGGVGWLYGGIAGAVVFKLMHDVISGITPQYWTFWIGLFLVVLVMVGRERLLRPWTWFGATRGRRERHRLEDGSAWSSASAASPPPTMSV